MQPIELVLGVALEVQVALLLVLLLLSSFHDGFVHCAVLALLLLLWRRCRIRWY